MKLPSLPQFAPVEGLEQEATEATEDLTADHSDATDPEAGRRESRQRV